MNKRSDRVVLILATTVLATALGIAAVALRRANSWMEGLPFLAGGCGEDLHASARSPNKKYVAAVFVRNCGATTSFGTHVNLRESSRPFSPTAHGTVDEGEVFMREGEGWVKLVWKGPNHLVVECPQTDVSEQKSSWRDVAITYQPFSK